MHVDLVDVNDNWPTFYPVHYAVSLSTQSSPGTSVIRVTAHDPDAGENGRVMYRTAPGGSSPFFTLNKDTGELSTTEVLILRSVGMYKKLQGNTKIKCLFKSLHCLKSDLKVAGT